MAAIETHTDFGDLSFGAKNHKLNDFKMFDNGTYTMITQNF